ncbi:MAG: GH32 C-terminal domain-containing protein [Acholeplasmatales bacterium]|nr:GH32 C-terminal domain-containing protein [Acholeplasmatales bacterium]
MFNKVKTTFSILMIMFVLVALAGCDSKESLPKKGEIEQENMNINPKSVVGYVGDVMPFYDNGIMNVYYLQDGRNTHLGFHPFALMTTTDMVNYHDYGEVIPYVDDIYDQDFALGTGSIIKDQNGLYHCFYTGHNDRKGSGLSYYEKIQHATSIDKINWTKHPEDGFYGGHNDFRDPYVYFESTENMYYMLVTTRVNDIGVIKQYRSKNLKVWTDCGVFFKNDSGSYNMECPTYIKYNDYYYLMYSEQGNHRVTHYRYKKNLTDQWIKPEVDYFDGEGFYAARAEKGFGKLYIFGWCGTKSGEWDLGGFDWGGNLVTHELVQLDNGELRPKIVSQIDEKINNEVEYNYADGSSINNLTFKATEKKAKIVEELSDNITKINFKVNVKELTGDFGLAFNTVSNNVLSNLLISFDVKYNSLVFYNDAVNFTDYGNPQITVPYEYNLNEDINVTLLIDGQILTVYLNNTITLSTRMYDMPNQKFSFYSNSANVEFKEIKFYE